MVELKNSPDATATMKDLNNAKKTFINEILKGKGLVDKLISAGIAGSNPRHLLL